MPFSLRHGGAAAVAIVCLWTAAPRAAVETINATAYVKTAGGVEATAPVTVTIDRLSTDAERDAAVAAVKQGGTRGVRDLLLTARPLGAVRVGATTTVIKYAYARPMGDRRLVTVITGSPIAFIGSSLPGAPPREGFDLGILLIDVGPARPGEGEMVPAAKIRVDDKGAIVTDDYGADVVRLRDIVVAK